MDDLRTRAGNVCELCGAADGLVALAVPPHDDGLDAHQVLVCTTCAPQLAPDAELEAKHWFCLQESAWSQVPAVQVTAVRLLRRLSAEGWAQDLLGQLYLEPETQAWADLGAADDREPAFDSNGAQLFDGDAVTLIKDLVVKGANFTAKRGTLVKGIRLTDDPTHIEGKVNKQQIVLRTEFLKRVN